MLKTDFVSSRPVNGDPIRLGLYRPLLSPLLESANFLFTAAPPQNPPPMFSPPPFSGECRGVFSPGRTAKFYLPTADRSMVSLPFPRFFLGDCGERCPSLLDPRKLEVDCLFSEDTWTGRQRPDPRREGL